MYSPLTDKHYGTSENTLELERLRVPGGWLVGMNQLYVGLDGGTDGLGPLLFCARHEGRRFGLDVDWLPEFDPEGRFYLKVTYQPWPRDERGRRRKNVPFEFDEDERTVHAFETRSYPELLTELERCLDRCRMWMIEGN